MSSQQACLVLCLAALAVAAPQLDLGDLRSVQIARDGLDREKVVAQVVAALTPQIQTAVAQALAALSTSAPSSTGGNTDSGSGLSTSPVAGSSFVSGSSSSLGSGLSSNGGLGTSSIVGSGISSNGAPGLSSNVVSGISSNGAGSLASSSFGQVPKSSTTSALPSTQQGSQTSVPKGGASQSNIQANPESNTSTAVNNAQSLTGQASGPTTKPVYNFEYKVSSEADQTYLSQNEERDGDQLTGSYRYVNPLGALITVNYQAGPMGFSQTIDQQEGFIVIRPKPLISFASGPSSSLDSIVSAKSDSDKSKSLLTGSKSMSTSGPSSSSLGSIISVKSDSVQTDSKVTSSTTQSGSSESIVPSSVSDASGSSSKAEPGSTVNQQELINRIISSLQQEITAAVQAALDRTKTETPMVSKSLDLTSKSTLQNASAITLNSIGESTGLPKGKATTTGIPKASPPVSSGRSAGTISPSTNSGGKPGVDRDVLSKFGSGLFVKIKTPNSEISY